MNVLIQKSATVNGEPNGAICGRGVAHRKLTTEQLKKLAADIVTGERQFRPSLAQTALIFGVTVTQIREELKERSAVRAAEHQQPDAVRALVNAWKTASEKLERETAILEIGIAEVWDAVARAID